MAKTENETKAKLNKGLQIRTFEGKVAAAKDGSTPEIKYNYDKVVLPWSRSGEDVKGEKPEGQVPNMSQLMDLFAKAGYSVEFEIADPENPSPSRPSAIGFMIDGYNSYLNITSRIKATNTKESALDKSIAQFMKLGLTREQAIAEIKSMVGAL